MNKLTTDIYFDLKEKEKDKDKDEDEEEEEEEDEEDYWPPYRQWSTSLSPKPSSHVFVWKTQRDE